MISAKALWQIDRMVFGPTGIQTPQTERSWSLSPSYLVVDGAVVPAFAVVVVDRARRLVLLAFLVLAMATIVVASFARLFLMPTILFLPSLCPHPLLALVLHRQPLVFAVARFFFPQNPF